MRLPWVSVPFASKWYHLLVTFPAGVRPPNGQYAHAMGLGRFERMPNGDIRFEADFPMDEDAPGSPCVDHAPNPRHVMSWATRHGWHVEDLSLELMVGRWELECGADRYKDMMEPAL